MHVKHTVTTHYPHRTLLVITVPSCKTYNSFSFFVMVKKRKTNKRKSGKIKEILQTTERVEIHVVMVVKCIVCICILLLDADFTFLFAAAAERLLKMF